MSPLSSLVTLVGGRKSKTRGCRTYHLHRRLLDPVQNGQDATQIKDHIESSHLNDNVTPSIRIQPATLNNEVIPISTYPHQAYSPPHSEPIRFREEHPPRCYRWGGQPCITHTEINNPPHNYGDAVDDYGLYKRWTRTKSEPPKPSWDVQRSRFDGGGTREAAMEPEPYLRRDEVHLHGRICMKEQRKGVQIVLDKIDPMENIRDRNIKSSRYSRSGRREACRNQTMTFTKENVYNSAVFSDSDNDADDKGDDEGDDEKDKQIRRLVTSKTVMAVQIPRASPWVLAGTI